MDDGIGEALRGQMASSFILWPCPGPAMSSLTEPSATFAVTFTSSASLFPALRCLSKQPLEGPWEQRHRSYQQGLPPPGMSQGPGRVRGWVGPAWASVLRDEGQPCWAPTQRI